jgi:translation elongation factor EF-1beta
MHIENIILNRSLFVDAEKLYNLKRAIEQLSSNVTSVEDVTTNVAQLKVETSAKKEDTDDFDLFADDDDQDDAEKERIKAERIAAYAAKKEKKPTVIAKSSVLFDVKPWDDETDMKGLEESVRNITMDGLVWGTAKLVSVAYGVKKLQIQCVIEDDKVKILFYFLF